MPPRVSATRAVILALLALLLPGDSSPGPRSVEASAVATDDACFYDVASGTCVASAVWVTGQHGLLRTPRANLLADVAAGIETCASAFGDVRPRRARLFATEVLTRRTEEEHDERAAYKKTTTFDACLLYTSPSPRD